MNYVLINVLPFDNFIFSVLNLWNSALDLAISDSTCEKFIKKTQNFMYIHHIKALTTKDTFEMVIIK